MQERADEWRRRRHPSSSSRQHDAHSGWGKLDGRTRDERTPLGRGQCRIFLATAVFLSFCTSLLESIDLHQPSSSPSQECLYTPDMPSHILAAVSSSGIQLQEILEATEEELAEILELDVVDATKLQQAAREAADGQGSHESHDAAAQSEGGGGDLVGVVHPDEVVCIVHVQHPTMKAYTPSQFWVGIGGLVPGATYKLEIVISANQIFRKVLQWDIEPGPAYNDDLLEKTVTLPALRPGAYQVEVLVRDAHVTLEHTDTLLAFRSLLVSVPRQQRRGGTPSGADTRGTCYQGSDSRRHATPFRGEWTPHAGPNAYWNLSCPLEWSKYSCAHIGNLTRAHAALRRFLPAGCTLADIDGEELVAGLGGRNLYFWGDSLLKQVFIALACSISAVVAEYQIPWEKNGWPCHGRPNCMGSGPHSGFHGATVLLHSGNKIQFLAGDFPPADGGVVVVEQGIHWPRLESVGGSMQRQFEVAANFLTQTVVELWQLGLHVVWLATPPSAFMTEFGEFEPDVLKDLEVRNGELPQCRHTVPNPHPRRVEEERALRASGVLQQLEGVVVLENMESLGDCKVGRSVGVHGDCQHYCMPGVPDELARVLYNLLVA